MKKWGFLLTVLVFTGCSTKTVYLPVIEKPNSVEKSDIRHLKIKNIQNDDISLKKNILKQMRFVNEIVPGYFVFKDGSQTYLSGKITKYITDTQYTKKVPVKIKGPACVYLFYPCKSIGNKMFCKNTPDIKLNPAQYAKLKKNIYTNGNYILYSKNIYKIKKSCRPTQAIIKCEKKELFINAYITIKNTDKTVFEKNYTYTKTKDPCSEINTFEGIKFYRTDGYFNIQKASCALAEKIINDLAPHITYFQTQLYEKPDIILSRNDEEKFKDIISNPVSLDEKVSILNILAKKYPKSCVIKYDLALFLIKKGNYRQAKKLLYQTYISSCDNNLKNSSYKILINLKNAYNSY